MTLQRQSAQCDVEVNMAFTKIGETYSVVIKDKEPVTNISGTEVYEILVQAFDDPDVRIPSRFVVEFGQHVINSLMQKMR
jgi:hypothetical protein